MQANIRATRKKRLQPVKKIDGQAAILPVTVAVRAVNQKLKPLPVCRFE
jgi:hypothetical protein